MRRLVVRTAQSNALEDAARSARRYGRPRSCEEIAIFGGGHRPVVAREEPNAT